MDTRRLKWQGRHGVKKDLIACISQQSLCVMGSDDDGSCRGYVVIRMRHFVVTWD